MNLLKAVSLKTGWRMNKFLEHLHPLRYVQSIIKLDIKEKNQILLAITISAFEISEVFYVNFQISFKKRKLEGKES